jgi:hypothetical protein
MNEESAQKRRGNSMPSLSKVLQQEDMARSGQVSQIDLSPYIHIIESIRTNGGVGGEVTLQADESQRAEKRRLTLAAKQVGTNLTWRKGADGVLKFVLNAPGEPVPGGRARRKSGATVAQSGRRRQSVRA